MQEHSLPKLMREIRWLTSENKPGMAFPSCIRHAWVPTVRGKPTEGCAVCWLARYLTIYGDLGDEWLDGAEAAVNKTLELIYQGKWDFKLTKPEIHIEKE